jgi:hypothetical protein
MPPGKNPKKPRPKKKSKGSSWMHQTVKVSVRVREGAGGSSVAPIVYAKYDPTPLSKPTHFIFDDGIPSVSVNRGNELHRSTGDGTDKPSTSSTGTQVLSRPLGDLELQEVKSNTNKSYVLFLWYHVKHTNVQQARTRTPLAVQEGINHSLLARAKIRVGGIVSPAVAHFSPAIGAGVASAGLVLKGVGALGNAEKAILTHGEFHAHKILRTINGIRSDAGAVHNAYTSVRGAGDPLEKDRCPTPPSLGPSSVPCELGRFSETP